MEHELSGNERGWWVVSHEAKLWLPKGELPFGSAANVGLAGMPALLIGEWAGNPVWLVCRTMPRDMGSVRQMLDVEPGLFQPAARGVQLVEFYRSHRHCGHEMRLPVRPLPRTLLPANRALHYRGHPP